jgi:hypothetical protein
MDFRKLLSSVALAALVSVPLTAGTMPFVVSAAQAQDANVSINIFFDRLGDQGSWIQRQDYGYVWVPENVSGDWAPYTHGHWADTERYGWTFVSDEPFAWAVYHYGRWGYDPEIGWFWVPGTVWAPAWVSWRRGHDAIGWAPLPPEGHGYAVSTKISYTEPPRGYWRFVRTRDFVSPDIATVIIRDERPYDETEYVGPVVVEHNVVVNNVIDVNYIEQATGRQVEVTRVQEVSDPAQAIEARRQGAIVAVTAPLAAPKQDVAPKKVVQATEIKAPTKGQDIQATTGSIKPADQNKATGEAAPGTGQANGGQQAEQPKAGQNQENAAKPATGEQNGTAATEQNKKLQTEQQGQNGQATGKTDEKAAKSTTDEGQPAGKRKLQTEQQGANAPTEGQNGQAAGKAGEKAAKGTTDEGQPAGKRKLQTEQQGANAPTEGQNGQSPEKSAKGEQPGEMKPRKGQGTSQNEAQAPAAKQGEQAKGTAAEQGNAQSAEKKLKKQGGDAATQSQNESGASSMKGQSQSAEQGQAAKGPRKLKQAEQPSQEKTGAIPEVKGGGEQAAPKASKGEGKAKGGCSAEQQSAGNC